MSYNPSKVDPELGRKVNEHLYNIGVQTPINHTFLEIDDSIKLEKITEHTRQILQILGLDLNDDSIQDTPSRVAKMYVKEIFQGLISENFPKCTTVENKMKYDEMVLEKDISIFSDCEHHIRPIVGYAHVAYIPEQKVLGLSKIPRICQYFARRPQIQERLTEQIFHALAFVLDTHNIAVSINASHLCVSQRGVEDVNSNTTTNKLGGVFKSDPRVRLEFFNSIRK